MSSLRLMPSPRSVRFGTASRGHKRPVAVEDVMALTKARSLLMILMATCQETQLALDAAGNVLDTDMSEDLRRMVARSQDELAVMEAKLAALRG